MRVSQGSRVLEVPLAPPTRTPSTWGALRLRVPALGVVGEVDDAEFLVGRWPVFDGVGVGQHRHDVAELTDERIDFVVGESALGGFVDSRSRVLRSRSTSAIQVAATVQLVLRSCGQPAEGLRPTGCRRMAL